LRELNECEILNAKVFVAGFQNYADIEATIKWNVTDIQKLSSFCFWRLRQQWVYNED
jgi:hypothetical protein